MDEKFKRIVTRNKNESVRVLTIGCKGFTHSAYVVILDKTSGGSFFIETVIDNPFCHKQEGPRRLKINYARKDGKKWNASGTIDGMGDKYWLGEVKGSGNAITVTKSGMIFESNHVQIILRADLNLEQSSLKYGRLKTTSVLSVKQGENYEARIW